MTLPDPIADIRTLLLADAGVMAIAAANVYGGELPEALVTSMPEPVVVVTPAGGPGRPGFTKYRRSRVDTHCYGSTLNESWRLHLAVREALETMSRRHQSLIGLEMASDAANARDPLKQWPVCLASYRLLSTTAV